RRRGHVTGRPADATSATAIAHQTHHFTEPVHISTAVGTGTGIHGNNVMADNQRSMPRRAPTARPTMLATTNAPTSHQGDGSVPRREATGELASVSDPSDTHN